MAHRLTLALPGDINTLTGGYIYDKRVLAELSRQGWEVSTLSLNARFPSVDDTVKEVTAQELAQVPAERDLIIDGLALGALGDHAQVVAAKRHFIALVHHPLALEAGLAPDAARQLHDSEAKALGHAQGVVVTSPTTRQTLIDQYGVSAGQIAVIEPGVDRPAVLPVRTQPHDNRPLKLLSVGAIVPRKGFDVLIDALAGLSALPWTLDLVGDDQRSVHTTTHLKQLIKQQGLTDRVRLVGTQSTEALANYYREADLFVLASHYEGYGMAYTEALAWGLPVVGTDGGASAQTLNTPAARIVAVNDVAQLLHVLRDVMTDQTQRADMQHAAREHANALPTWHSAAEQFAQAIKRMCMP